MTIDLLLEALEMLKNRGDHPDYKAKEIHQSIIELKTLEHNTPDVDKELWHGSVHVVGTGPANNIVNILMYDEYNQIMHEKGRVDFADFLLRAKGSYGLEAVPVQMLREGFDLISDLWLDNNADGYNEEMLWQNQVKKFMKWHDGLLATDESIHRISRQNYSLTFYGRTVEIPCNADTHTAVERLCRDALDE